MSSNFDIPGQEGANYDESDDSGSCYIFADTSGDSWGDTPETNTAPSAIPVHSNNEQKRDYLEEPCPCGRTGSSTTLRAKTERTGYSYVDTKVDILAAEASAIDATESPEAFGFTKKGPIDEDDYENALVQLVSLCRALKYNVGRPLGMRARLEISTEVLKTVIMCEVPPYRKDLLALRKEITDSICAIDSSAQKLLDAGLKVLCMLFSIYRNDELKSFLINMGMSWALGLLIETQPFSDQDAKSDATDSSYQSSFKGTSLQAVVEHNTSPSKYSDLSLSIEPLSSDISGAGNDATSRPKSRVYEHYRRLTKSLKARPRC